MPDHPIVGLPPLPDAASERAELLQRLAEAILERYGAVTTRALAASLGEAAEDAPGDG